MEAAISGIVALLLSLKYTDFKAKKAKESLEALQAKVESVEVNTSKMDKEMAGKFVTTLLPVAKAVNRLNQEVGIQ